MGAAKEALGNLGDFLNPINRLPSPKPPATPAAPAPAPEMQDESIRNAKLMERRRQLGLVGRGSTWLTGARGDTAPVSTSKKTLLGG